MKLPTEILLHIQSFIINKKTNIIFCNIHKFYFLEHVIKFKSVLKNITSCWYNFNLKQNLNFLFIDETW